VFIQFIYYRDKKVVGVFVRFSCTPLLTEKISNLKVTIVNAQVYVADPRG
jgi:hypothetical protein